MDYFPIVCCLLTIFGIIDAATFGFRTCTQSIDQYSASPNANSVYYQLGQHRYKCTIAATPDFDTAYTCDTDALEPSAVCTDFLPVITSSDFVQINHLGVDDMCISAVIANGQEYAVDPRRVGNDVIDLASNEGIDVLYKRRYVVVNEDVFMTLPPSYESKADVAPFCFSTSKKNYIAVQDPVDYSTAKSKCANYQITVDVPGILATWSSENEYDEILSAMESTDGSNAWVNLDDINAEGKWKMDGQDCSNVGIGGADDCDDLVQWNVGPHNNGLKDCAHISDDQLVSDFCYNTANYVCEIQADLDLSQLLPGIPVRAPFDAPTEPLAPINNYILEFTSVKDMAFLFSVLLNVLTVVIGCYAAMRGMAGAQRGYVTVNPKMMDDEEL